MGRLTFDFQTRELGGWVGGGCDDRWDGERERSEEIRCVASSLQFGHDSVLSRLYSAQNDPFH